MQPEVEPILIGHLSGLPYLVVFATALLAGYLIPAPEEVIFVLLGYLAVFQDINILLVALISILGVVVSDNIAFALGLKGSAAVGKIKKWMNARQIEKYENLIHRHAGKTVFTSRFIPTLRVIVPILAGTLKISWKKFFWYDLSAAILNIGALIMLGYFFESQISKVLSTVQSTRHILSLASLFFIGAIISLLARSLFFKKD